VPGPQSAARLPETGGDDVVLGLGALGIALYLAGVASFVVRRSSFVVRRSSFVVWHAWPRSWPC
jgi:LPXTG-motif cell wall-anchored protein